MPYENPMLDKLLIALDDIQAVDVVVIDVRGHTSITDYMVIASGRASRHVKAIAETVMVDMKKAGLPALSATGLETGDWAVVDFGDIVLHLMQAESRQYYNLEGLWNNVN